MKSLMLLWTKLAEESASRCCTCATRDVKYVSRRFEHEGFSFLTITLPTFGKDFEKGLDQGYVDRNLFTGFPWQAGLPRLFGGFLDRVFDRVSGALLEEPCIDAILAVRQLSLMFNKILLDSTKVRQVKAMQTYLQCEQDVRTSDASITNQQWFNFRRVAALLFTGVFTEVDREVYNGELLPKHGPGATADKLRGNAKYRQSTWPSRLERYFPMGEYLLPNYRYYDSLDKVDILEPGSEVPVKVISVPKTLKTPRIIGVEPTAMQYCQQALSRSLISAIKRDDNLRSMIGFDDQPVNQRMAKIGSEYLNLATLDLSEASDRVSNQHVRELIRPHAHLHGAVDASRSRKAVVLGQTVRLAKFASMGSALCFPMEAMVFLTLIFLGIEREQSALLCARDVKRLRRQVRVYGDDIIVPVEYVRSVISSLESFGIRVNENKSFWNGKFRESCGKEYYDGSDVSIVRVRRVWPSSRRDAQEVISLISLRNQLYLAGYWETVRWLDQEIEKVIKYFPVVLPTSPAKGRVSFLGYETEKMHDTLHSPLVRGYVVSGKSPRDLLEDEAALLKCLLRLERREPSTLPGHNYPEEERLDHFYRDIGSLPTVDDRHLERSGRPQAVNIKLRWVSPF